MNTSINNLKELARGMRKTALDYGESRISREFSLAADRLGLEAQMVEDTLDNMWVEIAQKNQEIYDIKNTLIYKIFKFLRYYKN